MSAAPTRAWQPYEAVYGAGHSVTGNVLVLPGFASPQLENSRDLLVYLPPGYHDSGRRYPVFYMHDGQNLFDARTGFGGQEWEVDETLDRLSAEGLSAIVVGLPNAGAARLSEYNPFPYVNYGRGDQYLAFVVETVKPRIDRDFRTLADREHTGLMGSSMGGLISLYGFFRHAAVFGRLGCLSPALWYASGAIYPFVEAAPFVGGRIYLDHGSRDINAGRMARLLRQKGYRDGHDLLYIKEEGGEHSETAWARRLPAALRFLLEGTVP